MKRIISFVLVIVFLTTAVVSVYGQSEFKEYNGYFIKFQYPVEWESEMKEGLDYKGLDIDKDKRISFDIPNTKGEGAFTILIEEIDKKTLDELFQEEVQSTKETESLLGYKEEILKITDVNLSNQPAKGIIIDVEEYDRKILRILALHDNKKYSITYRMNSDSFYDHASTIKKIIQSIKFIKNE